MSAMSDPTRMMSPTPSDLVDVAEACYSVLSPATAMDWQARAGSLKWSCRETLEHLASLAFAPQLAMRATSFTPLALSVTPDATIDQLLWTARALAHILADVASAADAGARAFHPAGIADPSGWLAMGMDELILHTHDISLGLALRFVPDESSVRIVLDRLFPWWPREAEPWSALLWANGKSAPAGYEDLGATWVWHCAPLDEWNGIIPKWDTARGQPVSDH
jgi:hypothetical protein